MIENTNTKQFYPGPILNNTLEITDFLFNDAEQIKIKHSKLNEEGVLIDVDLDYSTDYEVTKILPSDIDATEAALTASTGQVLLKNVNVLAGEKLTVYRVSQIIQDVDYPRTGAFPAASHEGALDYLTMQNQEQQEQINRSLKIPNSVETFDAQMPTPLPARALKINANGTGFEMSEFDPDVALITTEEFKNQAQQAAIEALASQNVATQQANIATEQATIATEQANIATEQATIATEQATIATNKTSEVVASGNEALSNIDTAKDNAITTITTQETTSKNNVIAIGNEQVDRVIATGNNYDNLTHKNITNCLLEVPQRIKLELNDGVLTLKAGSQVIIPNGFEADGTTPKFDYVAIESDISVTPTSELATDKHIICYNRTDNALLCRIIHASGTSPSGDYTIYYNTATNVVRDTNLTDKEISLPISFATVGNLAFTSIDQVFNGMGYIGSTVWVDKGVKGLIPNGRNEDGTLNNIEYTVDNILVYTNQQFSTYNGDFFVKEDGGIVYILTEEGFNVVNIPDNNAPQGYYYVSENNKMYWHPTGQGYQEMNSFKVATLYSNGSIWEDADIKLPFRAVDYNDFKETTQRYVVEKSNKSLLPSWYTVYSDGWCEQGSSDEITSTISVTNKTVALLKKYKDANYTVNYQITTTYTAALNSAYWQIISKTTTNFVVKSDATASWRACGYLAEGEY